MNKAAPDGKLIIAFSLWGSSRLYCEGALRNVELANKYYPGWTPRFYISEDCPVFHNLEKTNAELIIMEPAPTLDKTKSDWHNSKLHTLMFNRFLAAGDPSVARVIWRDTDSRLNAREAQAVLEWEESGALGHLIYDHSAQLQCSLMPGMAGLVGGLFPNISILIDKFTTNYERLYPGERWVFSDIIFCRDILFRSIDFSIMAHGYNMPNPLIVPMPEDGSLGAHVGSVVNEHWRGETYNG